MPASKIVAILLGFPIVSTLISLLLLDRGILSWTGLDFFTAFWLLITFWYVAQIAILAKVLKSSGWSWSDIGYSFNRKKTAYFVAGYLCLAFALLGFVQYALANVGTDPNKVKALSDLANLTPKNLPQRIVFVFMGLAAGLCEELVYRGFAIRSMKSRGINHWIAAFIAAFPFVFQHGLKSLDQFSWFFIWAMVFGAIFIIFKRIYINIFIHWLVILSAVLAILQTLK
ncbi:CPBP family intramembrane glutamic endopeptidase [Cognatiluteimonas telluris]|jgi:membrane protease YdiL (CAAX protease family)|uniref:CPBP family intramembrane glutamic endopeptidase n=1 Tax=Cognatiluteimonas telluris TaxID=1104775 RepID=UPI00140CF1C4|nr:CPBP family intramembrane glutamic endopeptidase [Lysobacter telluris]